ncbi:hypothetical protein AOCH_007645 [Aspergillus ochraceoroseus]|uniref:Uncharacterized protein n=1 Tax=Aspergillus ochraceoroseus TaxID=138278 RepID=A0A0F8URV4_9EURO|nr:hypothetical protein AOCH_007645 [Aspergillus ochraceoroseus]
MKPKTPIDIIAYN